MGRKSRYETHVKPHLPEIQEWYELLTEGQIAKKLGISIATFENYKKKYPELLEMLQKGKQHLIEELKSSLKKKAMGFTYKEKKTTVRDEGGQKIRIIEEFERYAQPDTGAIHLLLKNLDDEWHNDDQATIDMKKKQLEIAQQKADEENW
jgi:hypothetical protein